MQVPTEKGRIELPERTRSRLESFRRRLWLVKIAEGLLAGLFGLMTSYTLVFVLDRFGETPATVRAAVLVLGTLVLGIGVPWTLHRWIWRTRQLEQVARLLRRRFPRLGDQLLGIVELAHARRAEQHCSEALLRAAVEQVDEDFAKRNLEDVVSNTVLWKWGVAAGLLTLLVAIVFFLSPAASVNALARWALPWLATERYTFAQLDPLPDEMVVPLAEEFALSAKLSDETAWSPRQGFVRYGAQEPIPSALEENKYDFLLPPQKEADTVTVSIGDARKKVSVAPTPRPELTQIVAHVTLPEYLKYSHGLQQDVRGGATSLVHGSRVRFEATATRNVTFASLDGSPQTTRGSRIVTDEQLVRESMEPELIWRDELGLEGKRPLVLTIHATEDEPPVITCGGAAFEQVMLEDDVLTFEIKSADDYGVKAVGMEWEGIKSRYRNPHPATGEKMLMRGKPEDRELPLSATFSAKREGIAPQSLRLRMFAIDYLPDRKRVYSPTFLVHVLTPEEHNIWLTHQLAKWFRQATDVQEKERMLYQTNVELRSLPADELDLPENRRRIETQAAAEQANARRLDTVTSAGQELIREALKNEQFNAETLETWAEMLNALEEIARNRMPSVADLLNNAASSRAGGRDQQKPGQPSQSQTASGPRVGNNRNSTPGGPGQPKKGQTAAVPKIADVESGFNENKSEQQQNKEPGQAGSGRLTLPVTTLVGGGPPPKQKPPAAPAQKKLAKAVEEQQGLLDEFARVADELQRILDNLEGSTFVKRFKAASRRQMELATDVNTGLLDSFGVAAGKVRAAAVKHAGNLAEREEAQSDLVWWIQSDLRAYYDRVRDGKFKIVLDEMKEENPVGGLEDVGGTITRNRTGVAIASAEYWADALDRWGEQLVGPACPCNGQCPPAKGASLPPAIVLEVMRILEKEINLREETRAAELARPSLEAKEFRKRSRSLGNTQNEIGDMVTGAIKSIGELETARDFMREVALLSRVEEIMREAAGLLAGGETGPPTIAAETEAIELLLQAKRINPNGGGGGGATPGGGGGGDTDEAALALLGSGDELNATRIARTTGQATGVSGRSFPAEFRAGLDAFFGALEGLRDLGE